MMSLKYYIALTGIALVTQGAWQPPWTPYLANQDALHAFESKEYETGIRYLQEAVKANPADPRLHYNLGHIQYASQDYEQALSAYQRALDLNPPSPEQALLYYNQGNAYYRKGQSQGNPQQDWQQAIESYQRTLALNPADKEAKDNLEFVQQQLDKVNQQLNQSSPKGQGQGNPPPNPTQPGQQGQPPPQSSQQDPAQQQEPSQRYDEKEISQFLNALEQDERRHRNPNYFKRYPNQRPNSQDLFNLSPEELMNLSPQELAEMLKDRAQGSSREKDW